jgi:hypothetical protein
VPEQIPDRLKIDTLGEQERGARVVAKLATLRVGTFSATRGVQRGAKCSEYAPLIWSSRACEGASTTLASFTRRALG